MHSKSEEVARLLAFLALVIISSSLTIVSSSVAFGAAEAALALA